MSEANTLIREGKDFGTSNRCKEKEGKPLAKREEKDIKKGGKKDISKNKGMSHRTRGLTSDFFCCQGTGGEALRSEQVSWI